MATSTMITLLLRQKREDSLIRLALYLPRYPQMNLPLFLLAKLLIFSDVAKYPRHILKIPHQRSNCCQIRNSQRVISRKNRYFRPFLPCFWAVFSNVPLFGTIWRGQKTPCRQEPAGHYIFSDILCQFRMKTSTMILLGDCTRQIFTSQFLPLIVPTALHTSP